MTSPVQSSYRLEELVMKYIEHDDVEGVQTIAQTLKSYPEYHQNFDYFYQSNDKTTIRGTLVAKVATSTRFKDLLKAVNGVRDWCLSKNKQKSCAQQ